MGSEFTGVDKVLTIQLAGRELKFHLNGLDSLQFMWEEWQSGDLNTYKSLPITIEKLFNLLTMKLDKAYAIADGMLQEELVRLREQLSTMKDTTAKLEAANQVLLSEKRTLTKAFGLLSPQEGECKATHRS